MAPAWPRLKREWAFVDPTKRARRSERPFTCSARRDDSNCLVVVFGSGLALQMDPSSAFALGGKASSLFPETRLGWKASLQFLQIQAVVPPSRSLQVKAAAPAKAHGWRERARPIKPGAPYPARDHCSNCGLCDTYYVAHVKDACAFLGDGAQV